MKMLMELKIQGLPQLPWTIRHNAYPRGAYCNSNQAIISMMIEYKENTRTVVLKL